MGINPPASLLRYICEDSEIWLKLVGAETGMIRRPGTMPAGARNLEDQT